MARSAIPAATQASVAIRPLDREGPTREGRAEPVNGSVTRQFVALLMDHEGPFGVRVTVDGPLGSRRRGQPGGRHLRSPARARPHRALPRAVRARRRAVGQGAAAPAAAPSVDD